MSSLISPSITKTDSKPNPLGLFFAWWYQDISKEFKIIIIASLKRIYHFFSIPYLVKTLFAPWKRDVRTPVNPSIQDQLRIFIDNLISRFMGFIVRFATIFVGVVILVIVSIIGLVIVVLQYIILLFVLFFFLYGIYLILS